MKTMQVFQVFFLVVASVPVFFCDSGELPLPQVGGPPETRSLFAPLDDVHLLSNGLLQLGQNMREFVQKTKGQIKTIFQKLNIFDRSFARLSALAGEIKEGEEELKKTTLALNTHNEEIKELSESISSKMESILQEKSQLLTKVESMEEKLSRLSVGLVTVRQVAEINSLREVIQRQEQSIKDLLKATVEQGKHLNHQMIKIKLLEGKLVASTSAQETIGRTSGIATSDLPTAAPFLTSGTSSGVVMHFPLDCSQLFEKGERTSGIYTIKPIGSESFMAFCDMSRGRGGTVIQHRRDSSMNFDEPWEKYEHGFGDLQGDFWLGLKKMYCLASQGNSVLSIQLEDLNQNRYFVEYRLYLEGSESNYAIRLIYLSGGLPNLMSNHTGVVFSTKDRDNGNHRASGCTHPQSGGWWFSSCEDINLNERYLRLRASGRPERRRRILWRAGQKAFHSFTFTQMSIRPRDSINTTNPAPVPTESADTTPAISL